MRIGLSPRVPKQGVIEKNYEGDKAEQDGSGI